MDPTLLRQLGTKLFDLPAQVCAAGTSVFPAKINCRIAFVDRATVGVSAGIQFGAQPGGMAVVARIALRESQIRAGGNGRKLGLSAAGFG